MPALPHPVFDANATQTTEFGELPNWDLSDLYDGENAPELKRDLDWLEAECKSFAADYQGKLAELSPEEMLICVKRDEKISNIAGRIMSFAGLRYYQNTTDAERAKFMSDCQDKITAFTTGLVFFSLEFNEIPDRIKDGQVVVDFVRLGSYRSREGSYDGICW